MRGIKRKYFRSKSFIPNPEGKIGGYTSTQCPPKKSFATALMYLAIYCHTSYIWRYFEWIVWYLCSAVILINTRNPQRSYCCRLYVQNFHLGYSAISWDFEVSFLTIWDPRHSVFSWLGCLISVSVAVINNRNPQRSYCCKLIWYPSYPLGCYS